MGSCYLPFGTDWKKVFNEATIATAIGITWRECIDAPYEGRDWNKNNHIPAYTQVVILGQELGMPLEEIKNVWFGVWRERKKGQADMNKRPQGETRDNKGVYVGSGGSHSNKIRYPKLNRSKKVWAKFYEMFPYAARLDNWDGEKSDRYPRKNKKKNR